MQELKQKQKENLQSILAHTQTHIQSENIKKLAGGIVVASTGLKKWFKEKWVDIGRPKKKKGGKKKKSMGGLTAAQKKMTDYFTSNGKVRSMASHQKITLKQHLKD